MTYASYKTHVSLYLYRHLLWFSNASTEKLAMHFFYTEKLVGLYCGFEYNDQKDFVVINCIPQLNVLGFVMRR